MILCTDLTQFVLVYIHNTAKATLHCCTIKTRGINLNSLSCVNVQQSSLENCPLGLICLRRFFLPTNAFDLIQIFLQVNLRLFSDLSLTWNSISTAFPLSPSACHPSASWTAFWLLPNYYRSGNIESAKQSSLLIHKGSIFMFFDISLTGIFPYVKHLLVQISPTESK